MSMKKSDLAKNLGLKVASQMKATGVPGRFAQGAAGLTDKREQRRRDAAAGLVPFACKLPVDLARRLHEQAAKHEGGLNALMAELLARPAENSPAPEAKKPARKKAVSRTP